MGRKNKYGEETIPTTFRIPKSKVSEVTDIVNAKLDSYVVVEQKPKPLPKVKKAVPGVEKEIPVQQKKEYKDTLPEIKTVNFPGECPNCRFTTIQKTGLRLRMSMCQKCKDEKKLNKNK